SLNPFFTCLLLLWPQHRRCTVAGVAPMRDDDEFAGNSESGRVLNMAEPAENHHLVDTITNPELGWVGPEPRGIASVITPTTLGVYTIVEEDKEPLDWEVHIPDANHRIFSKFSDDGFEVKPTLQLFFRVFKLQRQTMRDGRHSWVSLKQQVKLFKMFIDSSWSFKERFYIVRSATQFAMDSLFETELDINPDGTVRLDDQGVEMTRSVSRFHLCWSKKHFEKSTDYYHTKEETMSPEDLDGLESLKAYVESFQSGRWETKSGVPMLDEHMNEQYGKKFINTKELLDYKNAAEAKLCLGIDLDGVLIFYLFFLCIFIFLSDFFLLEILTFS
ncbi:hypothetical protein A2U01_0005864, partial [Trifolium medium]|nr:hypothetical protein [Trifolium medium]